MREACRCRLAVCSAILALLASATSLSASTIVAGDRESVRLNPERWEGPHDLSFEARVTASDGVLHVDADVTDDRVVWEGSATDRVTVWIADATIVADTEKTRAVVTEQRRETETEVAGSDPALVKQVLQGLADVEQRWRDDAGTAAAAIASAPRTAAAAPATSRYTRTSHGYRAVLTIPLTGVLTPTSGAATEVRYLVEVSDVDGEGTADVATAMVAPANGVATAPSTFARLPLPRRWRLPLDGEQRVARALSPEGRFERRDGAYVYVLGESAVTDWTFDGSCCTSNVSVPPRWQPFEPLDVSHLAGTRLYIGADAVLFVAGGRRVRLPIDGAEALFQAKRGGKYYLVFTENAASRAGSPNSMCGAGQETSLIWIQLSAALQEQRRQAILVGSCWFNLDEDYETAAAHVRGETDVVDTSSGAHTGRVAYRYDNERPQRGLVIRPVTAKPEQ